MSSTTLFIDTNKLPRLRTPQGEVTEILNRELVGAKNVLGSLRWLKAGETFAAEAVDKHQLIYLMEGKGSIRLEVKTTKCQEAQASISVRRKRRASKRRPRHR